ncbi:hypothetical protein HmCmsJML283_02243 [Escherichia coli]|nr:hypothetical protein HmCmsJML088_01103 [Escherichia coli]GDE24343.1 hypothetical protein HmCmsJML283_02243 [Escherichia coli]
MVGVIVHHYGDVKGAVPVGGGDARVGRQVHRQVSEAAVDLRKRAGKCEAGGVDAARINGAARPANRFKGKAARQSDRHRQAGAVGVRVRHGNGGQGDGR